MADIIELAKEAGCHASVITGAICFNPEALELFADLVAAHEREACAKVCDDLHHWAANCCAKDIRARGEK